MKPVWKLSGEEAGRFHVNWWEGTGGALFKKGSFIAFGKTIDTTLDLSTRWIHPRLALFVCVCVCASVCAVCLLPSWWSLRDPLKV